MYLIPLLTLLAAPLVAIDYYEQGKRFSEQHLQEKVQNTDELKKKILLAKPIRSENQHVEEQAQGKCIANRAIQTDPETSLYVFVSFSMPEVALLSLAKEVEKVRGVMVLRGLPGNSFKQFTSQLYKLRKQGLQAAIQVDPRLFSKYGITAVPAFVTKTGERFDKLMGNVSLSFALGKMDNEAASALRRLL